DILQFADVHIVKGTPLKRTSLVVAGIERCARVVVFAKSLGGAAEGEKEFVDANCVFVVKMMQKEWPQTPYIIELQNGANVKYFSHQHSRVEWDPDNLRMQSILNNYALSVSDRLALYHKVRTEAAGRGESFWKRLVAFARGEGEVEGGGAGGNVTQRKKKVKGGKEEGGEGLLYEVDKEYMEEDDENDEEGDEDEGDEEKVGLVPAPTVAPSGGLTQPHRRNTLSTLTPQQTTTTTQQQPSTSAATAETSLTSAYLTRLVEQAEQTETGFSTSHTYHFDPHFAAGCVTTSSFMHSLLCQSYFRPYIIDVIKALASDVVHVRCGREWGGK
ncbi:hypothetical protein HK097_006610, partial [Rhizophlyctis rosea]